MKEFKKYSFKTNFAFIDEATKKEIRRKLLKAVSIPGYQVPYSSPEMPIARGWGTGGLHISFSLIGKEDTLKVFDQGSDASVNACTLRDFIAKTTDCKTTFNSSEATIIQTRHRIPEEKLNPGQIMVLQVPQPEPLKEIVRHEAVARQMHAEMDYSKMWLVLYESYIKFGAILLSSDYPVRVNDRYIMSPTPIPRWDTPNLNNNDCLFLFGAGREKRLYAIPPYTKVQPLEFEDLKFEIENFKNIKCSMTGKNLAFMDEVYDDSGSKSHVINDSAYLDKLLEKATPEQHSNYYLNKLKNG